MRYKNILVFILVFLLCFTFAGCKKKGREQQEDKEKDFNVYVDVKDKEAQTLIKFLTEEYKKKNPKSKLKINDVLGGEDAIVEDVNKGTEADVIITSRSEMLELCQKGLLSDMSQQYEKNKISEKNYNIMSSYGRIGDKYYGIALMPNTLEIFYNDSALTKLGISTPKNINDMVIFLKKLSANNIRIPVILPEDLNINTALTSIAASNRIKVTKLDEAYDNKNKYSELNEMQGVFNDLNSFVKLTGMNKNSFEIGNEATLSSLISGTSPIVLATSSYYNKLKDAPVSVIEEIAITNDIKANMPIIVNALLCMPTNAKNNDEAGKFVKFVLGEEVQETLGKKGYITANKKANAELKGLGEKIAKHLSASNDNSMIYLYSLPKKLEGSISAKGEAILSNKYSGMEWEEAIIETYKK